MTKNEILIKVENEYAEIYNKLIALKTFIDNGSIRELNDRQQYLLLIQKYAMETYAECLKCRIDDIKTH